jgi:septum site-determining protein MinD
LGEVIALLSGTGGMGKTSLTAGLAIALAKSGKKILCVDCQAGFGTLDIYLGLESQDALSYADICRGDYPLSRAATHPELPKLSFLAAPVRPENVEDTFGNVIHLAKAEFDYVFLNAPAGFGEMAQLSAQMADRCIVLCSMDTTSIRTAGRVADRLQILGKSDVRLVVNRLQVDMLKPMKLTVDDIMDQVGLPLLGLVPEDGQVTLFSAAGKFPSGKKWAFAAFDRIAKRMQGQPVPIPTR